VSNRPAIEVAPDTPLRLDVAAAIAYPDGSMSAHGLRLEHQRGRLAIERVAGKDYTTLADIRRMRELCRLAGKARDSGSGKNAERARDELIPPSGSLSTDDISRARDACQTIVQELRENSRATSRKSTSPARPKANVIRFASRSRTRSRSTPAT
jgi:hypothetical protein